MTTDRQRRFEVTIGIFLLIFAIVIGWDTIHLNQLHIQQAEKLAREHMVLVKQVDCNNQILIVLRKRSDARILVDLNTMRAQEAMVAVLNDFSEGGGDIPPNDPHIQTARDAFQKASEARANPDLWAPYPDCKG